MLLNKAELLTVHTEFSPRWWLRNPHVQTVYASKLAKRPDIDTRKERLELSDGDFLDLNWSKKTTGPIVCLFHGLAGCIDSGYARGAFYALETAGYRPVFMHHRGCSGEPNRLATSYHSGHTLDMAAVIDLVHSRFPTSPVATIGYSLGANALLKFLGESGDSSGVDVAIAVCPPLDLATCATTINTGLAKVYQRYLLSLLHKQYNAKKARYPQLGLPELADSLNTFWRFDDAVTAPLHGFTDVHHYYEACSARPFVPEIKTHTHLLYALNDPFFSPSVLPDEHTTPNNVHLHTPKYGGHVGFVEHAAPADFKHWLDRQLVQWLNARFSKREQVNHYL